MHEIRLAKLDKVRPVLILTREVALPGMTKVTVAPITSTRKDLVSEVRVGLINGLDHDSVISLDNILTISQQALGRHVGILSEEQEHQLAMAFIAAFDLALPLTY